MARITTYGNDSTVSLQDKLLGTDSQTSGTKNFPVESIVDFLNNSGLVDVFDGVLYQFEEIDSSNTDPQGVINVTGTSALATNFSAITSLIVSDKGKDSIDYTAYFSGLTNYRIKISQTDNKNNYGIFKITAQGDWATDDKYRQLTLTHQSSNGQLTPNKSYFMSIFQASIDSDLSARNVTEFGDVTSAGSGAIITAAERTIVNNSLLHSDVVNNLTTTTSDIPLSANQGKVLKDEIDAINTLLTSDNTDLDTLQEVVDYIEANKSSLDSLSISNIAGLQSALDGKVAVVAGKGLSANDFTDALLTKLNGIATGAEVNVQANWNETDGASDAFIANKPTDVTDLSTHSVTETSDVSGAGSGYIITDAERTKLQGIATGAEVNVNADWDASSGDAQILNKPGVVQYDEAQTLTTGQKTQALSNLGVNSTPDELNILDGVTATSTELNILDGVTATTSELNTLDGITASVTELNYTDGVTSAIQTQIDGKEDTIAAGGLDPDRIAQDSATDGQALVWSDTNSQWEPGTINVASGTIDGTGSSGKIAKFSDSDTIADSVITESSGGNIGIGNASPTHKLDVNGTTNLAGDLNISEFLKHAGDTDTYMRFQNNDVSFVAGNTATLRFTSSNTIFNDGAAKNDVRIETSNDNNTFYVDASEDRVGIKTSTPSVSLDVNATDAIQMPAGTEAQRPTGAAGMFRYNSTSGKFEGYTTEWGAIAGSGGAGANDTGTVTIEKNVYTGDGTDTTFDTTTSITNENNVQVYLDGVYQSKDNYSTSGTTVTFTTAPPNGVSIELIHFVATTGQLSLQSFTGDGSTTAYGLGQTITDENNTQVYLDGVYQSKDNYSTSGSTLTFSTAPASGVDIEIVHIKPVDVSGMSSDLFTGDGTTTGFNLTQTPSAEARTLVFIQGVYQEKSTYSLSSNTITFTTAPPDGYSIEVTVFNKIAILDNTVNIERFTGDGSDTDFVLTNAPSSGNNLDVYISGLYQEKNTYTFTGSTITFDEAPVTGAVVECRSITNVTNVVAADNDFVNFDWDTTAKTAAFTAVANRGYFVDTSSSAITVTMPSSPSAGDTVKIVDYGANAATNNITITSSDDIENSSDDKIINYDKGAVELVYSGSTKGWLVASAANETATALTDPNFNVDFLVIAGGGGGGGVANSGGGGAGGYRTSYGTTNGGGSAVETALSLTTNTDYTVTVGGGGSGATTANVNGTNGSDSIFSTITSKGGGGGGGNNSSGLSGGSGGGSGYQGTSGGAALTSPTTQGYAGGTGASTASNYGSGGGGGAGGVGGNGNGSTTGDGGVGLSSSITGTAVTRASGGSGGGNSDTPVATAGGGGVAGTNATANTGGGGGGGSTLISNAGTNGGSGVVILRYPNNYTISETTSPAVLTFSTATDGNYKVTTFTAGTSGTIQFS